MTGLKELRKSIAKRKVILFVGSGVSATLGLPDWSAFISKLGHDMGYDPDIFLTLGEFQTLADFYLLTGGSRTDIAHFLDLPVATTVDIAKSTTHQVIIEKDFPLIYTTNYDDWLEQAFDRHGRKYQKIVDGIDISKVDRATTQIIKFHGDIRRPETLVLTESDYFERLKFESELDIKLRSDMLEYSILFIGYSLRDVNLRNMLHRLATFRRQYSFTRFAVSYIFLTRPNVVQEQVFKAWGVETISSDEIDDKKALESFMAGL